MKRKVAIIGSHGIYASYGGWDQLVRNLAEKKGEGVEYLIFNSRETKKSINPPNGVTVKRIALSASGFEGLFYDFISILYCYNKVDTILLLGVQGMPILPLLLLFRKIKIVSNVGGIEWERPKFGLMAKLYLKLCFRLSLKFSDTVILDNEHFKSYLKGKPKADISIVPYGGEIDSTLGVSKELMEKYPFLAREYFISVSRSLVDNKLYELCESFVGKYNYLVLISNFSNSQYGKLVKETFEHRDNIFLIDGLYNKPELDLLRLNCTAYIHTHTLCGTAPSLVEMIVAGRPIVSIDVPQNRFTLQNHGYFFRSFIELDTILSKTGPPWDIVPPEDLRRLYSWDRVVMTYESLY